MPFKTAMRNAFPGKFESPVSHFFRGQESVFSEVEKFIQGKITPKGNTNNPGNSLEN
ncbi:MAG: hypothetical protein HKO79_00155 [Desulfobacterales bacterium]|nr:hypothetical protein [Deltaproteobacteria bacterium]NNL40887.1 hypothetical protein [Desulfobacterales bacterium]